MIILYGLNLLKGIIIMKQSDMPSYLRPMYCFPEIKPNNLTFSPIKVESPFKTVSKSFNIKTSYANSFSPSPQKHFQNAGQQILNASVYLSNGNATERVNKQTSKSKSLARVTDSVTEQSAIYGRKISPLQINATIKFDPEHFSAVVEKTTGFKISDRNTDWITQRDKRRLAQRYNEGEYIPSVSQMQVYGRKENLSKFEKNELWKPSSLISE